MLQALLNLAAHTHMLEHSVRVSPTRCRIGFHCTGAESFLNAVKVPWNHIFFSSTIFGDCVSKIWTFYSPCMHDLWPQPMSEKRLFVFWEYVCESSKVEDLRLHSDKTFCFIWKVEWSTVAAPSFPSLVGLLAARQGDMTPIEVFNNHIPLDKSPILHPPSFTCVCTVTHGVSGHSPWWTDPHCESIWAGAALFLFFPPLARFASDCHRLQHWVFQSSYSPMYLIQHDITVRSRQWHASCSSPYTHFPSRLCKFGCSKPLKTALSEIFTQWAKGFTSWNSSYIPWQGFAL